MDNTTDLFPVIREFSSRCRYNDCTHMAEAGCAVIAAAKSGELPATIYDSYVKLIKEQRRFEMSASDKTREGRRAGKMVREAMNYKRRFEGG
ncbi:MAG: hypothetical protein M3Y60_04175 [Bacteroidota bacterium]|nr:hypothetical protein [Bacteroidota bacterium]